MRDPLIWGMEAFAFFDRTILRVPGLSKEAATVETSVLLKSKLFRQALYLASRTLYDELGKRDFNWENCGEHLRHTLKRYHNRICYRATPFGAFASVSVVSWEQRQDDSGKKKGALGLCVDDESFITLILEDWDAERAEKHDHGDKDREYGLNTSLYSYGENFRLYETSENVESGALKFMLTEIDGKALPVSLLQNSVMSWTDLVLCFHELGMCLKDAGEYIKVLLTNQVLQRNKEIIKLPGVKEFNGPDETAKNQSIYAYTRNISRGAIDMEYQEKIRQGLHCLHSLSCRQELESMLEFKYRFTELFDRREISLLEALDPEKGIDFSGLAGWKENGEQVGISQKEKQASPVWSKVHKLFLRKWTTFHQSGYTSIVLDDKDLAELDRSELFSLPPSMMVLWSIVDNKVYIRSAGGASGMSIIGRYSVFDDEACQAARELAGIEQEVNTDVIFAEIVHDGELQDRDINRRAKLRNYEIPVLSPCNSEREQRIELNDLYLSVREGALILRSRRLNKRVIPRLSSAYNYRRSDFSIYRFLCGLQEEGIHSNLNLDIAALFPGLPYYPRVIYHDVILYAASWHLKAEVFGHLAAWDEEERYSGFCEIAMELFLPQWFNYEEQDQRLMINRKNKNDAILFLNTIRNKKHVVLRECFMDGSAYVKGSAGGEYAHELISFLYKGEKTYRDTGTPIRRFAEQERYCQVMGEWIYLKIYLHPGGMNAVLEKYIWPAIKQYQQLELIRGWHFVRFSDGQDHLRLRMQCSEGNTIETIVAMQELVKALTLAPNIQDVIFTGYNRELERYSSIGIEAAETLFWLSAQTVVAGISGEISNQESVLMDAIYYLHRVFARFRFTVAEESAFCRERYLYLFKLPDTDKEIKVELDIQYRAISSKLEGFMTGGQSRPEQEVYLNCLKETAKDLPVTELQTLLADLNHMHLNRLFTYDQPEQEAISYYFLHKFLKGLDGRGSRPAHR